MLKILRLIIKGMLKVDRFVLKRYLNVETPLYKLWWNNHVGLIQNKLDTAYHLRENANLFCNA